MELERSNLFVTGIDDRREWFRCHRLFRDALRRELDLSRPDQVGSSLLALPTGSWMRATSRRLSGIDWLPTTVAERPLSWRRRCDGSSIVARSSPTCAWRAGAQLGRASAPRSVCGAGLGGRLTGQVELVRPWLDAAESTLTDRSRPLHGWHSLRAAARNVRAISGHVGESDRSAAIADAEESVALETDPTLAGSAVARMTLGRVLQAAGEPEAAVEVLGEAMRLPAIGSAPVILRLQAAGALACALLDIGRAIRPIACAVRRGGRRHAGRTMERCSRSGPDPVAHRRGSGGVCPGRHRRGRALAGRAVDLGRVCGDASQEVLALTALAQAQLAAGNPEASAAALAEARDTAESEWTTPTALRELRAAEDEDRRGPLEPGDAGAPPRPLVEELTERECPSCAPCKGSSRSARSARRCTSRSTPSRATPRACIASSTSRRAEAAVQRGRALGLI